MGLLSCTIYKTYLYFIGYWLGEIIRTIIEIIFMDKKEKEKEKKINFKKEEELMKLFLLNIADLLTGFLVLYTKKTMKVLDSSKNHRKESKANKLETSLIYNDEPRFQHKIFLIPLISILDLIASSVYFFAALFSNITLNPRQFDWMVSIDIIARIFFSIIILKIIVRKHHKLGIILCIIGFILMSISDIISINNEDMNFLDILIFISIIFPKSILFPLVDVLYKIVLTNDFLLPHLLMFYRGLSQFPIIFIIILILHWNNKIDFEFLNEFNNYNRIIYTISFTIISCIRNLCVLEVIYIFNSHYVSFLLAIIIFENTIRKFFEDKIIYNFSDIKGITFFTVDITALLLISAGTLIFNEMIIINACGLKDKTKLNLINEEKGENKIIDESFYYEEEDDENNNSKENHSNENKSADNLINNSDEKNIIYSLDKENEDRENSF